MHKTPLPVYQPVVVVATLSKMDYIHFACKLPNRYANIPNILLLLLYNAFMLSSLSMNIQNLSFDYFNANSQQSNEIMLFAINKSECTAELMFGTNLNWFYWHWNRPREKFVLHFRKI